MRFNNRGYTDREILTTLVAVDNNTTGFIKDTEGYRVLAASAVAVPLTGSTSETILATITIPAGALGPNGILRITTLETNNNNANAKTLRYRLGGIGGTEFLTYAASTNVTFHTVRSIQNRGSQALQVGPPAGLSNVMAPTTTAPATATIDTSAETTLVITGQLGVGTDNMSLESYVVEVKYGA
jgi:hypothetical protein